MGLCDLSVSGSDGGIDASRRTSRSQSDEPKSMVGGGAGVGWETGEVRSRLPAPAFAERTEGGEEEGSAMRHKNKTRETMEGRRG